MKCSCSVLYIFLLCLSVNACASRSTLESQDTLRASGVARIYFICPSTFVGALQSMRVTVNDTKVGNLGVGTHLYVDRSPGQYHVVIEHEYDFGKWEQTIDIPSEKEFYFKIVPGPIAVTSTGSTAVATGRMHIIAVHEDEARSLIQATRD